MQSPAGRPEPPVYPLGLAYLAGQVEGHETSGLDLSASTDPAGDLRGALDARRPDVVALSLRNIDDSSYPSTWSYLGPFLGLFDVLDGWKGLLTVGGPGFTIYAAELMRACPRIDVGVAGEAESIFGGILERGASASGSHELLRPGPPDLASISPPDYGLFPVAPYEPHYGLGVQSRRGCAFGCTYCTYAFLGGRSFRCRPVSGVIGDIDALRSSGAGRFQFVDPVFNAPRRYAEELVEAVRSTFGGMTWGAWLDITATRGEMDAMAEAGCRKVDFSPDALTARGMRLLGKKGSFGALVRAVTGARRAGLETGVNFFNGNPGEGLTALLGKFAFMLAARALLGWNSTFVNIGTIRVYAGSRLSETMALNGEVPPGCDFLDPVFLRGGGMCDRMFRSFQTLRRRRHA